MSSKKVIVTVSILTVLFLLRPKMVLAARLFFDPQIITASKSATFQVAVHVDTSGVKTTSTDAIIPYDPTILEVVDVAPGEFYPQVFKNIAANKLSIGGTVTDPIDTRTGTGILSTIRFRGKALSTASLAFDCLQGSKTDSNVTQNDSGASDVLNCSQLVAATITISAEDTSNSSTPSATPSTSPSASTFATPLPPTSTPTATPSPTPTAIPLATATPINIPTSGTVEPTYILAGIGILILVSGLLIVR